MKLDDVLAIDNASPVLDPHLVRAMNVFGFVDVMYSLYHRPTQSPVFVGILTGVRADGSTQIWSGSGNTPDDAQTDTIDALTKWLLSQPIPPYYPTAGVTP